MLTAPLLPSIQSPIAGLRGQERCDRMGPAGSLVSAVGTSAMTIM